MRHLFDQGDEQAVLDELTRNQRKAELFSQACMQRGQSRQAANWARSARQIEDRCTLLKGAFLLSKRN
jgi:hypothetical protein